ncbi:hypothetical protein [Nonomuraea sp. GTA35]|uniref:hypothetical protein n=1 Tax=Nonomuraea sp. GTA35 TaxID=1676746 RepID=UPI0035BFB969
MTKADDKSQPAPRLSLLDFYAGRSTLRNTGTVGVVAGLLLAVIQLNSDRDPLWVLFFLALAAIGALIRIEAAIRDARR